MTLKTHGQLKFGFAARKWTSLATEWRTADNLCPVAAVMAFMAKRGRTPRPFFICPDSKPLTKAKFIEVLRDALWEVGLLKELLAGHSHRIGTATAAAQARLEDSTVMTLGQWNSAAFLRYIRTPKVVLAAATAHLSCVLAE